MNEKELTCLVSEEISNQFVEAIKNDNVAELRTLLEEGITIDSQIDYKFRNRRSLLWGAKPIHYAVLYGSLQCAKLLIERGADMSAICSVTALDEDCMDEDESESRVIKESFLPPFFYLVRDLFTTDDVESSIYSSVRNFLMLDSVDVNAIDSKGDNILKELIGYFQPDQKYVFYNEDYLKYEPLIYAFTELLIKQGIDVNNTQGDCVPICLAAKQGFKQLVKLLLQAGANRGVEQAIICAARGGYEDIVQLFLQHNMKAHRKYLIPVPEGYDKCYATLIENSYYPDASELEFAARSENPNRIILLLSLLSDKELENSYLEVVEARLEGDWSVIPLLKSLFDAGVVKTEDTNICGRNLLLVCLDEFLSCPNFSLPSFDYVATIIKMCYDYGFDLSECDDDGKDGLHYAKLYDMYAVRRGENVTEKMEDFVAALIQKQNRS